MDLELSTRGCKQSIKGGCEVRQVNKLVGLMGTPHSSTLLRPSPLHCAALQHCKTLLGSALLCSHFKAQLGNESWPKNTTGHHFVKDTIQIQQCGFLLQDGKLHWLYCTESLMPCAAHFWTDSGPLGSSWLWWTPQVCFHFYTSETLKNIMNWSQSTI